MLDESMFEDIHEIAENSAYLRAVEEKDVSLEMYEQLPPYEQCREIEDKLRADNRLTFECIFNEPTGFYCIKTFLIADYAVDKAIFIKDVEAYKSMRFESARRKVAALLYQRFVSTDPEHEFKHGLSVFQIIQQSKGAEEKKERDGKVQPASINLSASPSHAQSLELKTVIPPASPLNQSIANTSNGHNTAAGLPSPSAGATLTIQHVNGLTVGGPSASPHAAMQHSPITPSSPSHAAHTLLQMGSNNNPIGVYGKSVRIVREKVNRGEAPKDLFDEVARDVMTDLKLDAFPRFKQGEFYRRYIRTKAIETQKVQVKDFTTFRVLGRGGFGAVHACRKKNSGQIYAMKVDTHSSLLDTHYRSCMLPCRSPAVRFCLVCAPARLCCAACVQCINKKLVKVKSALDNVLEERNVLTMMKSHFVTNLKYGLQDDDTLYLIMDLMLGGDLKFHLINAGRFTEKRARFYAAQVLLGLEHVHKLSIIYRDMKVHNTTQHNTTHTAARLHSHIPLHTHSLTLSPLRAALSVVCAVWLYCQLENVLLDHAGHCKLSDLGLAVVTKVKIKGYAGTPGYTAPEMIKNKLYGPAADIFSYGVMLYRMLCGSKPFKGKVDRDLDKAVIERKPTFPKEIFSKEAISLLTGLLQKRPENRLGCGERGIEEIKEHPFFESIDWGLLEAGYIDPPFVPNKFDVNAASLKDIGDFDRAKYKHVKLDDRFKQRIKNFEYVNVRALQDEMVQVLEEGGRERQLREVRTAAAAGATNTTAVRRTLLHHRVTNHTTLPHIVTSNLQSISCTCCPSIASPSLARRPCPRPHLHPLFPTCPSQARISRSIAWSCWSCVVVGWLV